MRKWISGVLTVFIILVLAIRFTDAFARRAPDLPALPQPNGYGELLKLAQEIRVPPRDLSELTAPEIQEIAQANRDPLERVHQLVRGDAGVPLKTTKGWVEEHEDDVKKLKKLAFALGVQAQADIRAGKTNQAAAAMVDTMLLGQAMLRGGIRSDGVNGLVVETIGLGLLQPLVSTLDAASCRQAAADLEWMDSKRENPERILETERNWSAASFGVVHLVGSKLLRKADEKRRSEFLSRYQDATRRARRVMLMLAARALELETGSAVSSPDALVPAVLQRVPVDPKTGQAFSEIPRPAWSDAR